MLGVQIVILCVVFVILSGISGFFWWTEKEKKEKLESANKLLFIEKERLHEKIYNLTEFAQKIIENKTNGDVASEAFKLWENHKGVIKPQWIRGQVNRRIGDFSNVASHFARYVQTKEADRWAEELIETDENGDVAMAAAEMCIFRGSSKEWTRNQIQRNNGDVERAKKLLLREKILIDWRSK